MDIREPVVLCVIAFAVAFFVAVEFARHREDKKRQRKVDRHFEELRKR